MAKFEFRRVDVLEVGIENSEGVEFCDVMSTDLVGTDEKLHLWSGCEDGEG